MIGIAMTFLAGRFHATPWGHHVNEGAIEYPPSPWRLLRSLVATFHRARPADVTEERLTHIVSALAATPPVFRLPQAATAHTRHYDQANGGIKFFDSFVALDPQSQLVWLWKDAELEAEDRAALMSLLNSLGTFGRSESWCEATLLDEAEARAYLVDGNTANNGELLAWSVPLSDEETLIGREPVRVLMPNAEGAVLMTALLDDTDAMRKRKQLDPPGSRWLTYTRSLDLLTPRRARPTLRARNRNITIARFALDSNVLPLVQDSLPFSEVARRALIWWRGKVDPTNHSERIVGKTIDGNPLVGHRHAHYIATDENRDGRIDHLTIALRDTGDDKGFDERDMQAISNLRQIRWHEATHPIHTVLIGTGEAEDFGDGDTHAAPNVQPRIFQPSRRWRSVTPFVLPRFATRGAGKSARPRDMPEAQLRREAKSRGLPEIIRVESGDKREDLRGYQAKERAPVRWLEFKTRRFNGSSGYGVAGFEIEFAEALKPSQLPLALGFGCHFGLGLFVPVDNED